MSVTRSVSVLFLGFNSQLELSSSLILLATCTLADLAAELADLAISLSFLRVANQVALLPEVKMEGKQNFLKRRKKIINLCNIHKLCRYTVAKAFST